MKTWHARKIRCGIILADMWVEALTDTDPEGSDQATRRARRIADTAASLGALTWRAFDRRTKSRIVPTVRL